ncbi:hypothetical protein THAOC_02444 [Thalassiosira oceanica]|uniref:WW domain-containing protein n=1 Tax=Thalassiosira oceanica TaxID=159749 RepID=K0TEJ9_THAOC|nr:hypothetical protein THAOC_02444 [Thalassiosira oceanica]|eukprot:EJK75820.1 hypothetical protein THAOC_02444 [Thalassiosira oceanica]
MASKTSPAAARVVRLGVAVSLVMLPPLTDCWSPVARLRSDILAPGPLCRSRAIRTVRIDTSIQMSPASSEKPKLLAQEGDWAAYFDENFGKVYYFNHETGESMWTPPTPSFPSVSEDAVSGENKGQETPSPAQQDFYEVLQVPRTATRAQIKQSYLALAKQHDQLNKGNRRNKEFNDISRAWMVLSDGRQRSRYDRQLEKIDAQREMRAKMIQEEERWRQEEEYEYNNNKEDNKFQRNPIYKKKVDLLDEGNKFSRFLSSGVPPSIEDIEVDEDERMRVIEEAEYAEEMAMLAEEEAYIAEQVARDQEEADRDAAYMRTKQQFEEKRRASSERGVIQDKPLDSTDLNEMMRGMKRKLGKSVDEAARVKEELNRLNNAADATSKQSDANPNQGQQRKQRKSRAVLFPDQMMGRESPRQPKFISYVPPEDVDDEIVQDLPPDGRGPPPRQRPFQSGERDREQERLQSIKARGVGMGKQVEPNTNGFVGSPAIPTKTSSKAREQERLRNMKAMGMGGRPTPVERSTLGGPNESSTNVPPSVESPLAVDIEQLKKEHEENLARLTAEMEESASKTLEEEIVKIAKMHAVEISELREELEASADSRIRDIQAGSTKVEEEIEMLKMDQENELERMREQIVLGVEAEQAEKMYLMQAQHKAEIDEIIAMSNNGAVVDRLEGEIETMKDSHQAELNDMAASHQAEIDQLRAELEEQTAKLAQAHAAEISKLTGQIVAKSESSEYQKKIIDDLNAQHMKEISSLGTQHEKDLDNLRRELDAKSIRDATVKAEDVKREMIEQHKTDIELMKQQHQSEMDRLVKSELDKLKKQHADELAVAEADMTLLKTMAKNVTGELQRDGMSVSDKLGHVLKSIETLYDGEVLQQLRQEVEAREAELNEQIADGTRQMNELQSQLESDQGKEISLEQEIAKLTEWQQTAMSDFKRLRNDATARTSDMAALNKSIESYTREIHNLKKQLEQMGQERDEVHRELESIHKSKKQAEADKLQLERDVQSKELVINKLQSDLQIRHDDVDVLVPEVARLQELTASLNSVIREKTEEYELLQDEVERLKMQYSSSQSAATALHLMEKNLSDEQAKDKDLIANLRAELEAKEAALSELTASQAESVVADVESKLDQYNRESTQVLDDNKRDLASMSSSFEKEKAARDSEVQTSALAKQQERGTVVGSGFSSRRKN